MERHNRELRRREKLGTVWTERNLLALLQKQGLNNQPPKTKCYQCLTPAIPIRPVCGMLAGGAGPPALAPNPPSHLPERCHDDKTG